MDLRFSKFPRYVISMGEGGAPLHSDEAGCTDLALRDREVAKRSRLRDFGWYCLKAFVLVALLAILGKLAPSFPVAILLLIIPVYAVPATIGLMFDVVKNRLHKQDLYNEHGKMSHYNRRWFTWFGGLFIAYLVSSVLFFLQAPAWSPQQWALMCMAVVAYYFVFMAVQYLAKKEISVKYYKAKAIKGSIVVTTTLLAIAYAFIVAHPPVELQINLYEIVDGRFMPFKDSPCALLSEVDKITTYANRLSGYGLDKITNSSYAISLIANFIMGFSAFLGVVSQFGACLLTEKEIKSEFQLLPANDGDPEGVVLSRYIVLLLVIWLAFSAAFIAADHFVGEARKTEEYTVVNRWIDDTTDLAILATEENIEVVKEKYDAFEAAESFEQGFSQRRDSYISSETEEMIEVLQSYYDSCSDRVNSYMEWYDSVPGRAARIMPFFGDGIVRDEFVRRVIDPVSQADVENEYSEFLGGLKDLYEEHRTAEEFVTLPQSAIDITADEVAQARDIPSALNLWSPWDSEEGVRVVDEVLLGRGNGASQDARDRISEYIGFRNDEMQSIVKDIPGKFFPLQTTGNSFPVG